MSAMLHPPPSEEAGRDWAGVAQARRRGCTWRQRDTAWLYIDGQGVLRGRVDRMSGHADGPWLWWQTERATGCEQDLWAAKWVVEHLAADTRHDVPTRYL